LVTPAARDGAWAIDGDGETDMGPVQSLIAKRARKKAEREAKRRAKKELKKQTRNQAEKQVKRQTKKAVTSVVAGQADKAVPGAGAAIKSVDAAVSENQKAKKKAQKKKRFRF
jgi:TctA family transporter